MVAVGLDHGTGAPSLGRVDDALEVPRLLNHALDRRAVRADDGDDAVGSDHIAKADVNEPEHPKPPSFG